MSIVNYLGPYRKIGKNKGTLISSTRLVVKCDTCNSTSWETTWINRRIRSFDMCQTCKNKCGVTGMLGKKHTVEQRALWSKERSGNANPSKRTDVRAKISLKLKGRDAYWLKGKKRPEHASFMKKRMLDVWNSHEHFDLRAKYVDALENVRRILGIGHSKLHDEIKNMLISENIGKFQSEQRIDRFTVDELDIEHRVIIEIYGDFWHANPISYHADDIITFPGRHVRAGDLWNKDVDRRKVLEQLGFQVEIIWENEWKKDRESVIRRMNNVINGL